MRPFFLSFGLFTLAKGPQAALALCALAAAMVFVLLFQRPKYGRALLCLGGAAALFALLYRLLYAAGAGTSMVFSLFAMERTLAYQWLSPLTDRLCALLPGSGYLWLAGIGAADSFLMLPFQFLLWLRGVPAALRRLPRLDPAHTLAHAGAVGGFLAYHLFWHESSSQIYFALFGMLCMTLLAVEQLPSLRRPGLFSAAGWACGAAGLCTALCMALALCRAGGVQLARTAGLAGPADRPGAVTACDEEAALWLRAKRPRRHGVCHQPHQQRPAAVRRGRHFQRIHGIFWRAVLHGGLDLRHEQHGRAAADGGAPPRRGRPAV